MAFKTLNQLGDGYLAVKFLICGYDAVDTSRHLGLSTTNGQVRAGNTRRWFIRRFEEVSGKANYSAGYVGFKAHTLEEAVQRANSPAIQKRINAKFFSESEQSW